MPRIKVLKNPGFLYDLNYLFYSKFNTQLCVDGLPDEMKKESYAKYLEDTLQYFGDISDDLYVFFHARSDGRCFIKTYYLDQYKNQFSSGFNFRNFKELLSDTNLLVKNLIRFYLYDLSIEEVQKCIESNATLFSHIKESKYSGEEKSKLYEFFINPTSYFQILQYELIEKEIMLSNYYKENYEIILEAHSQNTFENLYENTRGIDDLSFLVESDQVLYTSICLLNKHCMNLFFVEDGAVYLLGFDYASMISAFVKSKKTHSLEELCGALSEASRVQILRLLLDRDEVTCKDLERIFNFSGSTAYHHVTLLTKIGAVKVRNEGKTIFYSLNRKYFDTLRDLLKVFSNN